MEDGSLLIWVLSGLIPFVVLAIIQSQVKDDYDFDKDFGEKSSMGMTFLLSIFLGPIFLLFVGYGIFHEIRRKKLLSKNKSKRD